jgi:hypothetical protein
MVHQFKNSPHGEQSMIREFFKSSNEGYYVDVGANHPTIESQSWHLEQLGWHGLLLEPLPDYCQLLKEKRSGTVIQTACSSPENHHQILKLINAGGHSTLIKAIVSKASYFCIRASRGAKEPRHDIG